MAGNKDLNRLKVVLVEKKEVQSIAIQTTGMCANDCVEMVHQFVATSVGDADENRKTA